MRFHNNLHYRGSSQLDFDGVYEGAESQHEWRAMEPLE